MTAFEFYRLRFTYVACAPLQFPVGKPANLLRGALGTVFRQLACAPDCPGAKVCARRQTCSYARAFEPASSGEGPSGLADWPRPFVFRARHLDGVAIQPGQRFWFDLHLFSLDRQLQADFVRTFEEMGRQGLGPGRARAELSGVERLDAQGRANDESPVCVSLAPLASAPASVEVEFLTPTELKAEQRIVTQPVFHVLFARVRDRISTLSALYGAGPLEIDFAGMAARAAAVRMTVCDTREVQVERRSSRTGQSHSLGGFVGAAVYEGALAEFLPFLEAARWTGVGRQTVWGKGEIAWGGDALHGDNHAAHRP